MGKCKTSVFKRPDTKVYFFHDGAFFTQKCRSGGVALPVVWMRARQFHNVFFLGVYDHWYLKVART